ncbi:unnamed protein product [Leptidea sinapis]|uniref:Uncharacterized protein n=1 Tax=Leptidea sinapis TaxID=189913 RepID=A0A5E4QBN6_9NEOP|nr:unnamed protein product [Leptidea sinapis]
MPLAAADVNQLGRSNEYGAEIVRQDADVFPDQRTKLSKFKDPAPTLLLVVRLSPSNTLPTRLPHSHPSPSPRLHRQSSGVHRSPPTQA